MFETAFKAGPTVLPGFLVFMGHETQMFVESKVFFCWLCFEAKE